MQVTESGMSSREAPMPPSRHIWVKHQGHELACIAHDNPGTQRLPVVWIHGLTMSVRFWEAAMYPSLARERSWYSVSLPWHYPSTFDHPLSHATLSERLLAELLGDAIATLIPSGKLHVVGHSLGAFAALNYAAKYPERVASVVSIGGFMTGRAPGLETALLFISKGGFFRKALFHLAYRLLQSHRLFLKIAALCYGRRWRTLLRLPVVDETLRMVFPDLRRHSIVSQRALCRFLLDMDLTDEIDKISAPVLMVVGSKDPVIRPEHQLDCAKRLKTAEVLLYQGVGHLAFAEAPDRFERDLLAWLDRHG